ncbi:MAG: GNAT family N-acetyltransferase [Candidatus Neomarinimicrobiota bacterium]|nr:MAG: GNAT family N-acetyltransferase [Candidatus Neomarinimicrobiota bacterium]
MSPEDRQAAFDIRRQVFIHEQGIPARLEQDGEDENATIVLARWQGVPVGTARFRRTVSGWKLERFAVLREFRNRGIGGALVQFILHSLPKGDRVYLHAQEGVIDFYRRYGFEPSGPPFREAGIVHQLMVHRLL